MIIDHDFAAHAVFAEESIAEALRRMSSLGAGVIYCVSPGGHLEGVLTDGDFRRWVVSQPSIDLELPVRRVANRDFVFARTDDPPESIEAMFSPRVGSVPILDVTDRLTAIAWPASRRISIGNHELGPGHPAVIIAEIGNNHQGELSEAIRLIDAAAEAGADAAKFQLRDMDALYINAGDPSDASADLGAQYTLDLLARFQLTKDELVEAFAHCRRRNLMPLCTPWDLPSLEFLETCDLAAYKIASADLTNHELIRTAADTGKTLVLSTGMSAESEILETVRLLERRGAPFVLLHCNSAYPAPLRDINLAYLDHLADLGDFRVGYSGHERGINVAIAAVARGATVIEKHLTFDRGQEGNDHAASLLPDELKDLVVAIREVEEAMGRGGERSLSQGELLNREVLAKSLIAKVPIREGEIIREEMLETKSPGRGLQPNRKQDLIGQPARRDLEAGSFFYPDDLGVTRAEVRDYNFGRPWGIPVRYHDWESLSSGSNAKLLEIHLSYRDMELDGLSYFPEQLDVDLVVHAPELFAGDHLLDLASPDPEYRSRSMQELQRVVDLTRLLKPRFSNTAPPLIIVNVGGFSLSAPISREEIPAYMERLAASLEELDTDGVEIIPQTMPPFPWHFGGQRFHNLLVTADDITEFCQSTGHRVCLDVSHSKLAMNHLDQSFDAFVRRVAPHTAHLHLADARGVDGEGLQIGDGGIDFGAVADIFADYPDASFIPEVWQGHKNDGEGFWRSLELLEQWF